MGAANKPIATAAASGDRAMSRLKVCVFFMVSFPVFVKYFRTIYKASDSSWLSPCDE
jgi:hypothetical protein